MEMHEIVTNWLSLKWRTNTQHHNGTYILFNHLHAFCMFLQPPSLKRRMYKARSFFTLSPDQDSLLIKFVQKQHKMLVTMNTSFLSIIRKSIRSRVEVRNVKSYFTKIMDPVLKSQSFLDIIHKMKTFEIIICNIYTHMTFACNEA